MVFCYMEHSVYPGYSVPGIRNISDVRNIQNVLNYPGIATTLPNIPKGFRAHVSANLLKIFFEKLETLPFRDSSEIQRRPECSGCFRISVLKAFNDFRHIGNFVPFWKFPPRRGKLFHMSTVSRYCEFQAIRNIPNVANVSNVRNIRNIRNCSLYSAIHWENFRNFVDFPNFYPYTEFLKILRLFTRIYGFLKFLQLFGGLR